MVEPGEKPVEGNADRCVLKEARTLAQLEAIVDIWSSSLPYKLCVIGGKVESAVSSGTRQDICSSDAYLIKQGTEPGKEYPLLSCDKHCDMCMRSHQGLWQFSGTTHLLWKEALGDCFLLEGAGALKWICGLQLG